MTDEDLLDHQWNQLENEEREWWEEQDSDETWIQKMLRLLKEEAKRWI